MGAGGAVPVEIGQVLAHEFAMQPDIVGGVAAPGLHQLKGGHRLPLLHQVPGQEAGGIGFTDIGIDAAEGKGVLQSAHGSL